MCRSERGEERAKRGEEDERSSGDARSCVTGGTTFALAGKSLIVSVPPGLCTSKIGHSGARGSESESGPGPWRKTDLSYSGAGRIGLEVDSAFSGMDERTGGSCAGKPETPGRTISIHSAALNFGDY